MQFVASDTGETSNLIGVVADDLTGACDTAAQFRLAGARVAVLLDGDENTPLSPDEWDVLVLSTEARRALPTIAAQRTREAVARLRAAGATRLYLKVDSILRGAPGGIIEAGAMEFGVPYVLVAPAFPAQGRVVVGGWVRRNDIAVTDGMTRLAETAIASIGHIPLRAIRSSMTAIAISPGLLADSVALLLADSERDDDLWTLAEYVASTELPMVAGSAGFARAIAPFWCMDTKFQDEEDTAWAERDGPVLVVIGTRSPPTQAQLRYLMREEYAEEVVIVSIDLEHADDALIALRDGLQSAPIVVVHLNIPPDATVTDDALALLARIAVQAAAERGDDLCGLVGTGGATTRAICDAAKATVLRVVDEVLPGASCSVLEDGLLAGVPIVSKSGSFGGEDALVVTCVWLLSEPEYDEDDDDEDEQDVEIESE